jgi:hypothetical protein
MLEQNYQNLYQILSNTIRVTELYLLCGLCELNLAAREGCRPEARDEYLEAAQKAYDGDIAPPKISC